MLIAFAACLSTTAASAQSTSFMILKGKDGVAPIHESADASTSVKTSVPVGLVVKSAGGSRTSADGTKWIKVTYGGKTGWVQAGSTFKLSNDNSELRKTAKTKAAEPKAAPVLKPEAETTTANVEPVVAPVGRVVPTPSASIAPAISPAPATNPTVEEQNPFSKPKSQKKSVFSDSNQSIERRLEEKKAKEKRRKLAKKRKLQWRRSVQKPKVKPRITASIRQSVRNHQIAKPKATPSPSDRTDAEIRNVTSPGRSGYRVQTSPLYMRAEPDGAYSPIFSLTYDNVVQKTGLVSEGWDGTLWWQVSSEGTVGWVKRSGLSLTEQYSPESTVRRTETVAPAVSQQPIRNSASAQARPAKSYSVSGASKGLRMRSGPGATFQAIGSIPGNERNLISTGEQRDGWVRIRYGRTEGWVSLDFVRAN